MLRAIRRVAIFCLKATLLALALAITFLAAWGFRAGAGVAFSHWNVGPDRVDFYYCRVASAGGRVVVIPQSRHFTGAAVERGKQGKAFWASAPTWQACDGYYARYDVDVTSRQWPVSWTDEGWKVDGCRQTARSLAFPCWLVILPAGAWPAITWTRQIRRWQRTRRRLRTGRCLACGYDLRATAEFAGPLVPRCPECGTVDVPTQAHALGGAA
jgi:hypothetical protein